MTSKDLNTYVPHNYKGKRGMHNKDIYKKWVAIGWFLVGCLFLGAFSFASVTITDTGSDYGATVISNVSDPVLAQDVATKNYVDSNAGFSGTYNRTGTSDTTIDANTNYTFLNYTGSGILSYTCFNARGGSLFSDTLFLIIDIDGTQFINQSVVWQNAGSGAQEGNSCFSGYQKFNNNIVVKVANTNSLNSVIGRIEVIYYKIT